MKKPPAIDPKANIVRPDFILAMIHELDANAHKGDFAKFKLKSREDGRDWLREHVVKLTDALAIGDAPEKVREHAADVANCAMKIEECFGPTPK